MGAGQFRDQGAHPRPVAASVFGGNARLANLAATGAYPFEQNEVGNLEFDFRQFDVLVGIERLEFVIGAAAT